MEPVWIRSLAARTSMVTTFAPVLQKKRSKRRNTDQRGNRVTENAIFKSYRSWAQKRYLCVLSTWIWLIKSRYQGALLHGLSLWNQTFKEKEHNAVELRYEETYYAAGARFLQQLFRFRFQWAWRRQISLTWNYSLYDTWIASNMSHIDDSWISPIQVSDSYFLKLHQNQSKFSYL